MPTSSRELLPWDSYVACAYCPTTIPRQDELPADWLLVSWDGYRAACPSCVKARKPPPKPRPKVRR